MRYRLKPPTIVAFTYSEALARAANNDPRMKIDKRNDTLLVESARKTWIRVLVGEYVVVEPETGYYYPCDQRVFAKHYEVIES